MRNEVNKSNTRSFTWDSPVIWNGNLYPTGIYPIMDNQGNTRNRTVFVDEGNQYHTINDEGREVPMALAYQLPEVTVTGHRPMKSAESHANDLLTLSNDMTQVNNFPHRRYNPNLDYQTQQGAKSNAAWREEHPNASAWGDALGAVPFAVAAYPFVAGAGSALGATTFGTDMAAMGQTLMEAPFVQTANMGLGAYGLYNGAKDIANGRFTPETAIDVIGGAPLMFKYGIPIMKKTIYRPFYESAKKDYIPDQIEYPFAFKKAAADRYMDFIESDDYANRLNKAGLEKRRDDLIDLANSTLGYGDFPLYETSLINGRPNVRGVSIVEGIPGIDGAYIKRGLTPTTLNETVDHETAHFATQNKKPTFWGITGKMMRYNKGIAPNRTWEDYSATLPTGLTQKNLKKKYKYYKYATKEQEKRARAYSLYQTAIREGLTPNELVDRFTINGKIADWAPNQLKELNIALTPENIKKYLNNFLSISTPVGIGAALTLNKSQYEERNNSR